MFKFFNVIEKNKELERMIKEKDEIIENLQNDLKKFTVPKEKIDVEINEEKNEELLAIFNESQKINLEEAVEECKKHFTNLLKNGKTNLWISEDSKNYAATSKVLKSKDKEMIDELISKLADEGIYSYYQPRETAFLGISEISYCLILNLYDRKK